jgi:protein dithiol:quinone oxidoreductase
LSLRFKAPPPWWQQPAARLLAVALLSVAAVAAALYSQHRLDMQPCPWCILQRIVFLAVAALAVLALLTRGVWRQSAGIGALLLAGCGMAAALWQHFVAAESASCKLTLADRIISGLGLDGWWPEVFGVFASCKDAKVNLAGVPYEFYSLALLLVLAALLWPVVRGR